jgi:hypothetical protein
MALSKHAPEEFAVGELVVFTHFGNPLSVGIDASSQMPNQSAGVNPSELALGICDDCRPRSLKLGF